MLSLQDRVRVALQEYGERDIAVTIPELSRKTGLSKNSVYQSLYRLKGQGDIELIKEPMGSTPGRDKIVGVRLNRMAKPSETIGRASKKAAAKEFEMTVQSVSEGYPNVMTYLKKRLAIENAKEQLISSGLDAESILKFDPDPLGEEAISLLQKLVDKTKEAVDLKFERDAAKRDIEFYEAQKKQETREMLEGAAHG